MHVTNDSSDGWLGLNDECDTRQRTRCVYESGGTQSGWSRGKSRPLSLND